MGVLAAGMATGTPLSSGGTPFSGLSGMTRRRSGTPLSAVGATQSSLSQQASGTPMPGTEGAAAPRDPFLNVNDPRAMAGFSGVPSSAPARGVGLSQGRAAYMDTYPYLYPTPSFGGGMHGQAVTSLPMV